MSNRTAHVDGRVNANSHGVKPDHLIDVFRIVNEHYRNDINAIWQRGQYFMLSDLGLLAFFYSNSFNRSHRMSVLTVASIGLALSVLWGCITIISSTWISVWRKEVVELEGAILPDGPFKRGEAIGGKRLHEFLRPQHFSTALAACFALLWLLILTDWIHVS